MAPSVGTRPCASTQAPRLGGYDVDMRPTSVADKELGTVLPQHVVETLPGLPDKLPNKLETGVGTFIIDYDNCKGGPTALKLNEYGWTKWLINHPKYLENPLYIFGESYAGIIIPLVVNEIYNGAEARDKPVLNMKSAKVNCHGNYVTVDPDNDLCRNALEKINQEDNVWLAHTWANDKSVQKALNVREAITRSSHIKSARILIFSGDHDMMAPHTSTEKWIESLNVPIKSDWRPWFVEGQIGGYTVQYAQGDYDLTYATIKPWLKPHLQKQQLCLL
ncbi:Serine carboxypeptidase-like 17 [Sesamum angolense]|uniref:Carboxypeptidase n=1 Tax=Sesamum angolense TaxID=2727404 RepID=A0AAE1T4L2_9LAMI|nr:Serine carboxypeptidase-like 17 [Sesamum angolense]